MKNVFFDACVLTPVVICEAQYICQWKYYSVYFLLMTGNSCSSDADSDDDGDGDGSSVVDGNGGGINNSISNND